MSLIFSTLCCLFILQDGEKVKCDKVETVTGHSKRITTVAISRDGKLGASGDADGNVKLWAINDGIKEITQFRAKLDDTITSSVNDLAFSMDGKFLAAASHDKTVWIWNVQNKGLVRRQRGHASGVKMITFLPDNKMAVSVDTDKNAYLWSIAKDQAPQKYGFRAYDISASQDGKHIAFSNGNETLVAETATGRIVNKVGSYCDLTCFTSDGRHLVKSSREGQVQAWELRANRKIWESNSRGSFVISMFVAPDRTSIYLTGSSRLYVIRAGNGDELAEIILDKNLRITCSAFSADGKHFLYGDERGSLTLCSVSKGK
jgi:WD40 repeat protein